MQLRGGGTDLLRGRNNFHNTVIPCLIHRLETLLPKMTRKLKLLALTRSLGLKYGEGYHKSNNYWVLNTTSSLLKDESTLKTKNSYTEICIIILEITSPNTHLPLKYQIAECGSECGLALGLLLFLRAPSKITSPTNMLRHMSDIMFDFFLRQTILHFQPYMLRCYPEA